MSSTIVIKTQVKDPALLQQAVAAVPGAEYLGQDSHQLFATTEYGHGVRLPDWHFPVVFDQMGDAHYDDYHGKWGKMSVLHHLLREYAVQVGIAEAHKLGVTPTIERLADSSIRMQIPIGGEAVPVGGSLDIQL